MRKLILIGLCIMTLLMASFASAASIMSNNEYYTYVDVLSSNVSNSLLNNVTMKYTYVDNTDFYDSSLYSSRLTDSLINQSLVNTSVVADTNMLISTIKDNSIIGSSNMDHSTIGASAVNNSGISYSTSTGSDIDDSNLITVTIISSTASGSTLSSCFIDPSEIYNSTVVGGSIINSTLNFSNSQYTDILWSNIQLSNVTNTTIDYSNLTTSSLYLSRAWHSSIIDVQAIDDNIGYFVWEPFSKNFYYSTVNNATINNCTIINASLSNAVCTNEYLTAGSLVYKNETFNAPGSLRLFYNRDPQIPTGLTPTNIDAETLLSFASSGLTNPSNANDANYNTYSSVSGSTGYTIENYTYSSGTMENFSLTYKYTINSNGGGATPSIEFKCYNYSSNSYSSIALQSFALGGGLTETLNIAVPQSCSAEGKPISISVNLDATDGGDSVYYYDSRLNYGPKFDQSITINCSGATDSDDQVYYIMDAFYNDGASSDWRNLVDTAISGVYVWNTHNVFDGPIDFRCRSTDTLENTSWFNPTDAMAMDHPHPVVTIDNPLSLDHFAGNINVQTTQSSTTGIDTSILQLINNASSIVFQRQLISGEGYDYILSSYNYTLNTSIFVDGEYVIKVITNDTLQGQTTIKTVNITIDNTNPVNQFDLLSEGAMYENNTDYDFFYSNENLNLVNYTIKRLSDGVIIQSQQVLLNGTVKTYHFTGTLDINNETKWSKGAYLINLYSIDEALLPMNTNRTIWVDHRPQIQNITVQSGIIPNEDTTKTTYMSYKVFDKDGAADIDDSFKGIVLTKSGETTHTTNNCTQSDNGQYIYYNCTMIMNFFDTPGVWNLTIASGDIGPWYLNTSDVSATFNYGTLSAIVSNSTSLNFGILNLGNLDRPADTPVIIRNTGNFNFSLIKVLGRNLLGEIDPSKIINANKFESSIYDVANTGTTLFDNVPLTVSGAHLSRGSNSTEYLYSFVDVPFSGITVQNYKQAGAWRVDLS